MARVHPITAGLYCVPSVIEAITGADPQSVIFPAINRAENAERILGAVAGVRRHVIPDVLRELGCRVFAYTGRAKLNSQVRTWAKRYPDRLIVVCGSQHCMLLHEGRVWDSWTPHGEPADRHCYSHIQAESVWLVKPREVSP